MRADTKALKNERCVSVLDVHEHPCVCSMTLGNGAPGTAGRCSFASRRGEWRNDFDATQRGFDGGPLDPPQGDCPCCLAGGHDKSDETVAVSLPVKQWLDIAPK